MLRSLIYLLLIATMLFAACRDASTPPDEQDGQLRILLQDDIIDYSSIVISIDSVAIMQVGTAVGWNYVNTTPHQYNLTDYRNGTMALLSELTLPPSYFDSIRVHFHPVSIIDNGVTHNLILAPEESTVFQQYVMVRIFADTTSEIVITVDLYHSVSYHQQLDTYYFAPQIEAVYTANTSVLRGRITPQADVYLWPSNDTSETRYTRSFFATGEFGFYAIPPGSYDIWHIPTPAYANDYDTLKNEAQIVVIGQDFDMGNLTLPPK